MKTMFLILFLILPASVMAQNGKPRAIEPIRVSINTDAREDGDRFSSLVRQELNKLRGVAIASRKPDYDLYLVATELTENGKSFGYACAVLVVEETKTSNRYKISIHTGRTLELVTQFAVGSINREYLQKRRE